MSRAIVGDTARHQRELALFSPQLAPSRGTSENLREREVVVESKMIIVRSNVEGGSKRLRPSPA